jgi:hypothetical protein
MKKNKKTCVKTYLAKQPDDKNCFSAGFKNNQPDRVNT